MARIAIVDCQVAGISGDMLVSALVHAGADAGKVTDAIYACQGTLEGSRIVKAGFSKVVTHGLAATRLDLQVTDSVHERRGSEMLRALKSACESVGLEQRARDFATRSLEAIISAESKIHGEDAESVHLHEASSIDTIADLMGAAVALQDLKLYDARFYSTEVAVGGGLLKFSHGTVPNPADAILEMFRGKKFNLVSGQATTELTTPTGAAMLASLAAGSEPHYPAISPQAVGYGAGTKEFEGFANALRIVVGESVAGQDFGRDSVCVIETDLDDATGEVIGNLVDRLSEVAKDVTVFPGTTKKSRPSHLIRIISEKAAMNDVLDILFAESGTLGARVQQVERFVLARMVTTMPVTVAGLTFNVHVKVARSAAGRLMNVKPEFEDVRIIAARTGMPVKQVLQVVTAQAVQKAGDI